MIDPIALQAAPRVVLGGVEYPVPELPWRQTTAIYTAVAAMNDLNLADISVEKVEAMLKVVWIGIAYATPTTTFEHLSNDAGTKLSEILKAFFVVLTAAGLQTGNAPLPLPAAAGAAKEAPTEAPSTLME